MTPQFPVEILHMIATHLLAAESSLRPCILVCRSWRAAFEPLIYSRLHISSTKATSIEDESVISLDLFEKITSGAGVIRRSWIQHIDYKIVVPHLLKNYTTIVDGNYDLDNPIRKANDTAFQRGIVRLFTLLSSWPAGLHVSLKLSLFGEELCIEEPETCEAVDTREFDYDFHDSKDIVPPYHAGFVDESYATLPKVACIKRLSFPRFEEHQIGAGAALQIVSCCSEMTELELALDYYIRPDHMDLIQARRHTIASGFETVPASLRVFNYFGQREEPWIECLPALKLIPDSSIDIFSINLRHISYRLRELYLRATVVDMDFLCPLDNDNMPANDMSAITWPNLQTITLDKYPPVLPSGLWLMNLTPEGQAAFDAITDMTQAIFTEESVPDRYVMDHEAFHLIFISLGHAAGRMPRLKEISFSLGFHVHLYFTFVRSSAGATLKWSDGPYSPDERVAKAWGFHADSVRVNDGDRCKDVEVRLS